MSVILLGYHNMGCLALSVLHDLGIEVPGVFTHTDSRDENCWFSSLTDLARDMGIPVYHPEDINQPEWVDMIEGMSPKVILSCYFRQMIKAEILAIPSMAAVNLHGSLLPKYRGRCPVNWQLLHGEKMGGVTLHHMVTQADAGDIVAQAQVPITDDDSPVSLYKKMVDASAPLLRKYLPLLLEGKAPRYPQDHSKASYYGGRRPEDGLIDWSKDAAGIRNLVRAVTWPYPGAFSFLDGKKINIWWATLFMEENPDLPPGTIFFRGDQCLVRTGKGSIRIDSASVGQSPPLDHFSPRDFLRDGGVFETNSS